MKKLIKNFNMYFLKLRKFLPILIISAGLLFTGSLTFILSTQTPSIQKTSETDSISSEQEVLGVTNNPAASSSATPSPGILKKATLAAKPSLTPSPTYTPTPSPTTSPSLNVSNPVNSSPVSNPTSQPSATPILSASPSATLIPSPSPSIAFIEIKQPDTTLTFETAITDGMNVCQLMQKIKYEGKVNSLTIDDKYLATFGTLMISEINGYKNNWIFTINGESPMGCSLVNLKNKDKIVWEFLSL